MHKKEFEKSSYVAAVKRVGVCMADMQKNAIQLTSSLTWLLSTSRLIISQKLICKTTVPARSSLFVIDSQHYKFNDVFHIESSFFK